MDHWRTTLDPADAERVGVLDDALGLCLRDRDLVVALLEPRGLTFQRLEFVGDSLLDIVAVRALLVRERWREPRLGELAADRQALVSDRALLRTARHARLPGVRAFRPSGQRLADRIEACIGAAWADGGVPAAESVASRLVVDPALADEPELAVRPRGVPPATALRAAEAVGYSFSDEAWLAWAEASGAPRRRLAQLGDALVEAAAATALYGAHPHAAEGELSERRRSMVTNHRLAAFGARVGLGPVGDGVGHHRARNGRRTRDEDRDAADSVQALLGAVALDGGLAIGLAAGYRVLGITARRPGSAGAATTHWRARTVTP